MACGLDGMDYGTPSTLPWSLVYLNPNSYAPIDGVARHPVVMGAPPGATSYFFGASFAGGTILTS